MTERPARGTEISNTGKACSPHNITRYRARVTSLGQTQSSLLDGVKFVHGVLEMVTDILFNTLVYFPIVQ